MDELIKKDSDLLWHPFTQSNDNGVLPPILIDRAEGIKLYDRAGNFYYDTISSWWCNIHGHNHPHIVNAMKKQLGKLDHVLFAGFTHEPAIKLAEQLVKIAPKNLSRIFYSDNGSTAVEVAMKMSLQYWRNIGQPLKTRFACLDRGYHGDTVGAMSVSGSGIFNKAFEPLMFPSLKIPTPYCYRCPLGLERKTCSMQCADVMEKTIRDNRDTLAAVIAEPILMGSGGMIIYPAEYLSRLAVAAHENNIHLILDEVATGFGRTGKMFACEHANVTPDFMCISKGLTSGTLPFAVTLTTQNVYDAFCDDYEKFKTLYHGHTYTANPLGCAAALASLEIFESENVLASLPAKSKLLSDMVLKFRDLPYVGDVRSIGMVAAIELVSDKHTKQGYDISARLGHRIYREGLKHNLILRPLGDVIYFFLPLCITHEEIELVTSRTFEIIRDIDKLPAWKT